VPNLYPERGEKKKPDGKEEPHYSKVLREEEKKKKKKERERRKQKKKQKRPCRVRMESRERRWYRESEGKKRNRNLFEPNCSTDTVFLR